MRSEPAFPSKTARDSTAGSATAKAHVPLDGLRESESRFRALFEHASDGVFIADLEGRFTDVNSAACRLLGHTPEEVVGRRIVDFIPSDAVARLQDTRERLLKGDIQVSEWSLRRKDGTYVPVEVSTRILPDGRWQAFARDMTDRRRTEEALRLSEAKFSAIYSASADAIISVDESGRITMFNQGAVSIFGYSREEIVGQPLEVLIPDRFRAIHRCHVERFSAGQQTARHMGSRTAKIYGLRKNGEEFPTDAAISKVTFYGKTLLVVSIRDISDEVRTEKEQRLLAEVGDILVNVGSDHERLLGDVANVIVRNIADWCSVYLLHDGALRRLRIVHSDPTKAEVSTALEQFPLDGRQPNPVSEAIATQRAVLVSDPPPEYFRSLVQSEEQLKLVREFDPGSFIVVPLIARGRSLGTIVYGASRQSHRYDARDVREAEHVASRVALAVDNARLHEALERAIQVRDEVLGIVAHDLRNPLNAIVLQALLLSLPARGPEASDGLYRRIAESITRSTTEMSRLIQDLLDVARVEAGHGLAIAPGIVSTECALTETIDRHRAAFSACHRELRLAAGNAATAIRADRARVLQVFDNLLGNAMKFSRSSVVVSAGVEDGEALFSVADDGPGICAEDLPRVFDRFWQAEKSDRRGAGLGLSIVKEIVSAHGGRTWVKSTVGEGATFYFTIPLAATRDSQPIAVPNSELPPRGVPTSSP